MRGRAEPAGCNTIDAEPLQQVGPAQECHYLLEAQQPIFPPCQLIVQIALDVGHTVAHAGGEEGLWEEPSSRRQRRKVRKWWGDISSDDASSEFGRLVAEQGGDGEEVWVYKNRTQVKRSGVERSQTEGVETRAELTAEQANTKRRRLSSKTSFSGTVTSPNQQVRQQRPPSPQPAQASPRPPTKITAPRLSSSLGRDHIATTPLLQLQSLLPMTCEMTDRQVHQRAGNLMTRSHMVAIA